jgi:branched-chain amino acid transport system permease protein
MPLFGISAYAFALLFQQAALNPFLAIFLAAAVLAAVCVPLGLILFRLRGAYFALSMLAFAEIVRLIAQEWTAVTNGAAGILFFSAFPDKATNYWLLLTMLGGSIVGTWLLVRSKPGASCRLSGRMRTQPRRWCGTAPSTAWPSWRARS